MPFTAIRQGIAKMKIDTIANPADTNAEMSANHPRMPVIFYKNKANKWSNYSINNISQLKNLLLFYPDSLIISLLVLECNMLRHISRRKVTKCKTSSEPPLRCKILQ